MLHITDIVHCYVYSIAMEVDRFTRLGLSPWLWLEREGDAAFHSQAYREAQQFYEASINEKPDNTSVLLKLSDVYFVFGDLEKEQRYREKVFGTLQGH
jgi:uncharacterized protein HemY